MTSYASSSKVLLLCTSQAVDSNLWYPPCICKCGLEMVVNMVLSEKLTKGKLYLHYQICGFINWFVPITCPATTMVSCCQEVVYRAQSLLIKDNKPLATSNPNFKKTNSLCSHQHYNVQFGDFRHEEG